MKTIKQKKEFNLEINNAPANHIAIWGSDMHGSLNVVQIERENISKLIKVLQKIETKGQKLKFKNKLFGC